MPGSALQPYPWHRLPRMSQRIRYGQSDLAHRELDVLLREFKQEHGSALPSLKLRCGMVMSYCLRGARLGGAASEPIMDEIMLGVDRLARTRSWTGVCRLMHDYVDRLLHQVVRHDQTRLERVIQQIQRDFAQAPGSAQVLQDYAREAKMHPDYLSRQFKQATGQTFCQARRTARLSKARHLLIGSELKISEIARRIGIHDASQFNREFRREFAMTGGQYRRQHQRG